VAVDASFSLTVIIHPHLYPHHRPHLLLLLLLLLSGLTTF